MAWSSSQVRDQALRSHENDGNRRRCPPPGPICQRACAAREGVVLAPLLQVEDLRTYFFTSNGVVRAVDGVSFDVEPGEVVGIVGESGSGKSTTALSILRLVPHPGRIVTGRILLGRGSDCRDIAQLPDDEVRELRGSDIAMIFQDPMKSLNPVLRVGYQVREAMAAHRRFSGRQADGRVVPMLERVRIAAARDRADDYQHQFSGGMRQRLMIAMGLSNEPSLLVADEPTVSLDVTVQAQIIELLRELNSELGTAIVLVTHNLAVVASLCTRVIVMYAGRIVEQGPIRQILKSPQHPYTWSLLRAVPRLDAPQGTHLTSIGGMPPDLGNLPTGCKFHPRCRFRVDRCRHEEPPLAAVDAGHLARCWVPMHVALDQQEGDLP
jgi:peptide/nickel transport system ATP-binding protein